MPRRVRNKPSLFAPAGNLLRRLSDSDVRLRRRVLKVSLWILVGFFVYTLMIGTYGIPRIVKLEFQKQSLIEANQRQLTALIDADRLRRMLETDPVYIESIARRHYYMARPNEIIYRYRGR